MKINQHSFVILTPARNFFLFFLACVLIESKFDCLNFPLNLAYNLQLNYILFLCVGQFETQTRNFKLQLSTAALSPNFGVAKSDFDDWLQTLYEAIKWLTISRWKWNFYSQSRTARIIIMIIIIFFVCEVGIKRKENWGNSWLLA